MSDSSIGSQGSVGQGSAVAKAILIGEHFVLHGAPALAVPLPGMVLTARLRCLSGAEAASSRWPEGHLGFCALTVMEGVGLADQAVQVSVESQIPLGSGLGSSAALSVALARAASALAGLPPDDVRDRRLSMACERRAHGRPSGVDTEVCVTGRPVWLEAGRFESLHGPGVAAAGLVTVYAGPGGATAEMISRVSRFGERNPERFQRLVEEARARSPRVRDALLAGAVSEAGALLSEGHAALREVGVSSPALEAAVASALDAGACGAKLSGAGGGGLVVALAPADQVAEVAGRLVSAGLKVLSFDPLG